MISKIISCEARCYQKEQPLKENPYDETLAAALKPVLSSDPNFRAIPLLALLVSRKLLMFYPANYKFVM